MKARIFALLGIIFFASVCMATIVYPPARYAHELTIYFSIYDSNSPWRFYETAPAADDISVRKDGGTRARATNSITDLDHVMKLVLTAAEMTAAVVTVDVNDESSPKLFGDETIIIPTFGHASAYRPIISVAEDYNDIGAMSESTMSAEINAILDAKGLTDAVIGYISALNTGVPLANDAITSAKYDESTAFPVSGAAIDGSALLTGSDVYAQAVAALGADANNSETHTAVTVTIPTLIGTPIDTSLVQDINNVADTANAINTATGTTIPALIAAGSIPGSTSGTIGTQSTALTFTLSADFPAVTGAYPDGAMLIFTDADTSKSYFGPIKSYTSGRVVRMRKALPVTPANGDVVIVIPIIVFTADF